MQDLATLACNLAPPFKSPQNRARCNAQSWLGSCSRWSSPSFLPPSASCVQRSVFWVPRALSPLTFIVSYTKSMGHSVWMSKMCGSGSESSYTGTDVHDEQHSGWPSALAKTIAKVKQEMLEDWHVTVRKLCERIPEVSKKSSTTCTTWQESSMKRI